MGGFSYGVITPNTKSKGDLHMKVHCRFCGADFHSPSKHLECPSCGSSSTEDLIFSKEDALPPAPESYMVYEVEYESAYVDKGHNDIRQCSKKTVEYMKSTPEYYKNVKVLRELGMTDTTWLQTWYKIGLDNYWIAQAWDPQFTINSFQECKTLDYLMTKLASGNWCTGQAFYYRNLAFINQVNGGDEWLIVRNDINFESWSCAYVLEVQGKDYFASDIYQMLNATDEQLKQLEYGNVEVPMEFEFDGVTYLKSILRT